MLSPSRAGMWMGLWACALAMALAMAMAPAARGEEAAAKKLAWKFAVGQRWRVETVSEMSRTTKIKANVDETKVKTTIAMLWEVKDVDGEGVATIEQRPERLVVTHEHRGGAKYELDSEFLAKNPQFRGADRDAVRLLMEGVMTLKVDPRGVVRETVAAPEWLEKLKGSALAEIGDQFTQAAELIPGVQLALPEGEIEAGAEWRSAAEGAEENARVRGEATFVYRGEAPLEGAPHDKIEIAVTLQGLPKGVVVTNQSNQGVFWFDGAAGRGVKLQLTQNWKAEKEYRDNVILLTTIGESSTTWTLLE